MSDARILICVPCHNRKAIVEQCLPTLLHGDGPHDTVVLYNDGSTEYDRKFLEKFDVHFIRENYPSIGIERQRRNHFDDFIKHNCQTHLYLTDSDSIHDPEWRSHALKLQDAANGLPVCLYNTAAHARLQGNTISEEGEIIWRRVAPGISYLLTREHVEQVVSAMRFSPKDAHWNWDWTVPAILGNRMAISKVSYVDHIGHGGYHHPADEGYDGGDRALNPTSWLVAKRAEIVRELKAL